MAELNDIYKKYQRSEEDVVIANLCAQYADQKVRELRVMRDAAREKDDTSWDAVIYDMVMNALYDGQIPVYKGKKEKIKNEQILPKIKADAVSSGLVSSETNDIDAFKIYYHNTILSAYGVYAKKYASYNEGAGLPMLSYKGWVAEVNNRIGIRNENKRIYEDAVKAAKENINIATGSARVTHTVELAQTQQAIQNTYNIRTVVFVVLIGSAIFIALKIFKIL